MIYKLFHKIKCKLERHCVIEGVEFTSQEAKRTVRVDEGVCILNPNVMIGNNVHLYNNVIIFGNGPVFIDENVKIGFNTIIYASDGGGVTIGKNCIIAANAYIIDSNHSTEVIVDVQKGKDTICPVKIGDNVWISAQCVIGKGSVLNDYAIIGANSFVNGYVPKNAIYAGSPAKLIKFRGQ